MSLIDLRILRDVWTEDGARSVFAELVTQCAISIYPNSQSLRPDPGDEGIDTLEGLFGSEQRVWQAKYFCEGVGNSQKAQIRKSWKSCLGGSAGENLKSWTLALPTNLSVPERKWWDKWKTKKMQESGVSVELWNKDSFLKFYTQPDLKPLFDLALTRRSSDVSSAESLVEKISGQAAASKIHPLPSGDALANAIFVRKLELAGVRTHLARRTAFYNFELFRESVDNGGLSAESSDLEDFRLRVLDLWEEEFSSRSQSQLGSPFVAHMDSRIAQEDNGRLSTELGLQLMHKKGALYEWADVCEAGWTSDYLESLDGQSTD